MTRSYHDRDKIADSGSESRYSKPFEEKVLRKVHERHAMMSTIDELAWRQHENGLRAMMIFTLQLTPVEQDKLRVLTLAVTEAPGAQQRVRSNEAVS